MRTTNLLLEKFLEYGNVRSFALSASLLFAVSAASTSVKAADTYYLMGMGDSGHGELGIGASVSAYSTVPKEIVGDVKAVAAGDEHSLYLTTDGTLYAMGVNTAGQLGDGTKTSRTTPVKIATGVAAIAASFSYSMYVTTDGTLYAMGSNNFGALGDGTTTTRTTPVQIATGVTAIAAGTHHSMYVTTDGTLYAMGWNAYGQLGDGTTTERTTPVQIATGVTAIAAGEFYSLYVTTDGTLYATGHNDCGQIGDGTRTNRITPVQIATGVTAISAGLNHSLFITTHISAYASNNDRGAKWDAVMGWIDDTYFPWVWDYTNSNWYYVYAGLAADTDSGYWIGWYTSDFSDYGWGYVYPPSTWAGWCCIKSDQTVHWLNAGDPLPTN